MSGRGNIWIICISVAALALAGCGVTPIPDDEVAGLAGKGTVGAGEI